MKGCCHTKKDLRKVLFLPLAVVGLLFAAWQIGWPTYQLVNIIKSNQWPSNAAYLSVALDSLQVLLGLIAGVSILVRWAPGVAFMNIAVKFIGGAYVISFVSLWFMWIAQLNGYFTDDGKKWKPTHGDIVYMAVTTCIYAIIFALYWFILSCFASLKMVIAVGGSGFEGRNYKEIKTGTNKVVYDSSTSGSSV